METTDLSSWRGSIRCRSHRASVAPSPSRPPGRRAL